MNSWARDAIFYHLYPLGACGAPRRNDFRSEPEPRLSVLEGWIPHIVELGCTAVWLGPVFESTAHGYDTADYRTVDRRLGRNGDLKRLVGRFHEAGIRVILDGVFNHAGRDFPPFRDLIEKGEASPYRGWFRGVDFSRRSPEGDRFSYEGWNGCYDLVRFDLGNGEARSYLLDSVRTWFSDFGIDGIRLDAADCVDLGFQRELAAMVRGIDPEAFLMGEIVHGDYRTWANGETLDSVTNYECYKGLWSSHRDGNYHEIAWSLDRQFGPSGMYRDLPLYAFAENHDVDRVASLVGKKAQLYPLYLLLYTMPGVPSVYYGGEWGLPDKRRPGDDSPVRPALDGIEAHGAEPDLARAIGRFARVRAGSSALRRGDYRGLLVEPRRLAFSRRHGDETVVVAVSALDSPTTARIPVGVPDGTVFTDLLNPGHRYTSSGGSLTCGLDPAWGRVLSTRTA
jgi:cyclomaltodextrinase / maltogenic alpha-amylase / neopullulanase